MKKSSSIFWGLILITIGVIFFGNVFEWWKLEIFFKGWWTLFIIIPSIYGIFNREWLSSILGIIIGTLLLLACRDIIAWSMVGKAFLPVVLILIGLFLLIRPKRSITFDEKGLPEYIGVFSSNGDKIKDKFNGASCISVFGSVSLDLTNSKIEKDIVIDCVSIFGGIEIKAPENIVIKKSGIPIFGGIENKLTQGNGHVILINYVCIFGGINIK